MASIRDKRLKTDSPTPVQPIEALSSTPTLKPTSTAIKLKRMSRNRSGVLSVKSENEDGNDSVGLSEDTQSSTASVDAIVVAKTPNTRTKRQPVKDEKEEESNGDIKSSEETSKNPETPRTRKLTKAQILKKKSAVLALARRQAMMKRQALPSPIKSSSRVIGRRLSGIAKADEGSIKEEEKSAVKKGKPGRKPAAEKLEKKEIKTHEEEVETAVNAPEIESAEKLEENNETDASLEVSLRAERNTSASAVDLLNVRRSTRQRKSTVKDRDSPFAGRRSQALDKSDSKRDSISPALSTASIKVEKENSKAISITVEQTETNEKDPSLSPELVSEEMDTESVQHLYDKPDFLENNLGIEQDPKLGEIVKVQEKTKVVESVIKSEEPVAAEDVEMKSVEEKENAADEKEIIEEKVDGKVKKENEVANDPESENLGVKNEVDAVDDELIEKALSEKEEQTDEENKENNAEGSVGSNSPRSEDRSKTITDEKVRKTDSAECELFKQKESHLMTLGLLTHKAADEAKLAKLKRKEELAKATVTHPASRAGKAKKDSYMNDPIYTGTLKTIIKLNRSDKEKRRTREPLKLTIQKKNRDRDSNGSSNSSESFYTIQEVSSIFNIKTKFFI